MSRNLRAILALCFFLSGFCGLLYQVVWLRLAFAAFGIVTPVLSVVISVFMLGLALGSWAAGRWVAAWARSGKGSAVYLYAACEAGIGLGAFAVPFVFGYGERLLLPLGEMDSFEYLVLSAGILAITILPWCILMGATFPLMLAFVKEIDRERNDSFSYLYAANVIGAAVGTAATALVLIEILGFTDTLLVAAASNFLIAGVAVLLGLRFGTTYAPVMGDASATAGEERSAAGLPFDTPRAMGALTILFTTGFCALALEVVWTRAFTPALGTTVYSFALLLFAYLVATFVGSWLYRRQLGRGKVLRTGSIMTALALVAPLPILLNDPRIAMNPLVILVSIFPFCLLLGHLTPKLVDRYSLGFPRRAGHAYAVNVVGCILGPLVASYAILPVMGVRYAMLVLAIPFLLLMLAHFRTGGFRGPSRMAFTGLSLGLLALAGGYSVSFEEGLLSEGAEIRRDHTATVISDGEGIGRGGQRLLVNGIGITHKNPANKVMAHMPLAFHENPRSALVICFGMGTTFRSLMSWDIDVTAVELVPSVRDAFSYYFDDAEALTKDPRGEIVIDDGRRFLQRTDKTFDVITIDPPPPVQAAGSSLLYSTEFYRLVKSRLNRGGIVQQWYPGATYFQDRTLALASDPKVKGTTPLSAVLRSAAEEFPYVRVYPSFLGWGWHILLSEEPLVEPTIDQIIARMPLEAREDLLEWDRKYGDLPGFVAAILSTRIDIERVLGENPDVRIEDDRPYNEYYLVRTVLEPPLPASEVRELTAQE
jgi:spermidine synthase